MEGNILNGHIYNNLLFKQINGEVISQIGNRLTWLQHVQYLKSTRFRDFLIPGTVNIQIQADLNIKLNTNFEILEYLPYTHTN